MNLKISEVTLRDGSYVTNFNFDINLVKNVCKGLEDCGIDFIEVGHGYGLGGKRRFGGKLDDAEHIIAAKSVTRTAKIGVFFIPGIGTLEDLKNAAELGVDFVRIGTNINQIDEAEKPLKLSKDLGMHSTSFLMKSYAMPPAKSGITIKKAENFGADAVVIVDSSGGMWPKIVSEYISNAKKNTDIEIGFHGHNNLSLAVSNSLSAVESGATWIDSTLCGIGRSGGNTQTEVFLTLLKKQGFEINVNLKNLYDLADQYVSPIWNHGVDSLDIVMGSADFHSSFLNIIEKFANLYKLDKRDLMMAVTKLEKENINEQIVEKVAHEISFKQQS